MKKIVFLMMLAGLVYACGNTSSETNNDSAQKEEKVKSITAAGATFPLPFYNLSFKTYTKAGGPLLTYGGIGSGGGIRSLKDKVVDFGATDAFLSPEKESKMPSEIVHIPTCIGAVVVAFNIPGVESVNLSNQNLEDIFMGKITNWNDSRIAENNAGVAFPDLGITFVHRSDGSGTTYIFSNYMSKISPEWENTVGKGKSLKWPVGVGAKGNPGVAGTIKQTKGAIGYIGSEFAFSQKITFAKVQNSNGEFVLPSIESISASANGEIPTNTKIMLTNSSDPQAYPISGFTWLILYKEQNYDGRTKAQAKATLEFLSWLIEEEAQALAQKVNYAPIPTKTVGIAKDILKSVTYINEPILN